MNLTLKKLCLTLFSASLMSGAFAAKPTTAPTPTPAPPATNTSNNSGNPTPTSANPAFSATSDNKIVLNFENADIQTVIKAISKLSGKNFVIDPRVKGTVNIVSDQPVSKAESYKVLEAALRMQGFATVEADGVIKVLPETDAKTYGMRTDSMGKNPGDQLITRVFSIDNGSATQLANTLRPMVSPNNSISVYPNSNAIVVTDYASNMTRIAKIIDDLRVTKTNDVPPAVIKIKYATAADVAQTLQSYLGQATSGGGAGGGGSAGGDNGPAVSITVDSNSNSIIISSRVPAKIEELKKIALSLDNEATKSNNNLHVVYLKNADAAHIAEVLNVIAAGQSEPDMPASPASRALSDTSSQLSSSGGSGGGSGGSPFGGSSGGSSGGAKPQQSASNRPTTGQNNDKNAPKVLIQAEPTTNALIIQAPEQIYRNLRMIITMLDVRRVQVMIEALIADVDTSEQGTFGIQWIGGAGNNNLGVGVISNYAGGGSSASSLVTSAMSIAQGANGSTGMTSTPSIPGEVYVGLVTGTTTIGGQTVPTISTLADMLSANSANNILGRPTLLTLDNEEASIFVGQNVGIPTGSFQNSAAAPGSISTANARQDVGTVLRIKPLVTQSGAIQLSVFEENSLIDNTGLTAQQLLQNGPNFNKRNIKTQILVDDGQIIALGGMTQDQILMQNSGIPVLSSIPYLGWLFSWQSRSHVKQNMVIFLRPVIIRNKDGYKALTNQRYSYIMGQENMIQAKGNLLFPQIDPVNLENQVPYDNSIPPQNANTPVTPIVDLRSNAVQSGKTQLNQPEPINQALQPKNNLLNNSMYQSNNSKTGTSVVQTAPNAVVITNNQTNQQ